MKHLLPLIAFAALATWGPASADGVAQGKKVDCYCTDTTGGRVEMGQMACLHVGGREFMARCDMSLNVPTWRDTGEDCLSG